MKRAVVYLLPVVGCCLAIFTLSAQPGTGLPGLPGMDKLLHVLAYGTLGAFSARALRGYQTGPARARLLGAGFAALYGATDEVHQLFTPHRFASVEDWVADLVGAVAGATLYVSWNQRKAG